MPGSQLYLARTSQTILQGSHHRASAQEALVPNNRNRMRLEGRLVDLERTGPLDSPHHSEAQAQLASDKGTRPATKARPCLEASQTRAILAAEEPQWLEGRSGTLQVMAVSLGTSQEEGSLERQGQASQQLEASSGSRAASHQITQEELRLRHRREGSSGSSQHSEALVRRDPSLVVDYNNNLQAQEAASLARILKMPRTRTRAAASAGTSQPMQQEAACSEGPQGQVEVCSEATRNKIQ